jgi:hypothetical protein
MILDFVEERLQEVQKVAGGNRILLTSSVFNSA